jgi:signal transduction histidine kinase/ligand-binding sensor domain-containing protein
MSFEWVKNLLPVCFSLSCLAQPLSNHFHSLIPEHGLSQSLNAFVYQDTRGFVWLSSLDGLNRFDGRNVRVYRPNDRNPRSLFGSNMQSPFFEDGAGNLWFCTFEAINCYRRRTDDFEHFFLKKPDGQLVTEGYYAFHFDEQNLWLRAGEALFLFDVTQQTQVSLGPMSGLRMAVGDGGDPGSKRVYACHFSGKRGFHSADVLDGKIVARDRFFQRKKKPPPNVQAILAEAENSVWLATDRGLLEYNPLKDSILEYGLPPGTTAPLWHIAPLDSRYLLVSQSGDGLSVFDKNEKRYVQRLTYEADNPRTIFGQQTKEVLADRSGNVWVSDWNNGVQFSQPQKRKFRVHRLTKEIPALAGQDVQIQCLMADEIGNIWVATDGQGVWRRGRQGDWKSVRSPWPRVGYLFMDGDGELWACGQNGIAKHDLVRDVFMEVKTEGLPRPLGGTFIGEWEGGLGVGTLEQGLWLVEKKTGGGYRASAVPGFEEGFVERFFKDSKGRHFIARNAAELVVLERNKVVKTFKSGYVKDFLEMPKGQTLWVATVYGLIKIDLQTLDYQIFTETEGLPNQYLYSVIPSDGGKYLWLASNKGIIRFSTSDGKSRHYGLNDGIWQNEFFSNAKAVTPDGRIWLGNKDAINVFHPDSLTDLPILPKIQITGIKVNDEPWQSPDSTYVGELVKLDFKHASNTVSFDFVGMEYSDPGNVRLRYQLGGFDPKPIDIQPGSPGFARYANLPPGHYTLKIWAANSDGVWTPEPKELALRIRPAYWQTWWFFLLCTSSLAGMVWWFYDFRRRRREQLQQLEYEKKLALEQERMRIARDMHDDLGSGLSALSLLTELAKRKGTTGELKAEIGKIGSSAAELNTKIREIIWMVSTRNDSLLNLLTFLRDHALDFFEKTSITCEIRLPDAIPDQPVPGEHRRAVLLAFKEALNNIVKHAGASAVQIKFTANRSLSIRIADNGRGFDPAAAIGKGNGLLNLRHRMEEVGGSCGFGNEGGAVVVLEVPLKS